MALLVTADFVWGNGEGHFGPHHYQVSVFTFDPQKRIYILRTEYITAAKYGAAQQFDAPSDLLQREQPQIMGKRLLNR